MEISDDQAARNHAFDDATATAADKVANLFPIFEEKWARLSDEADKRHADSNSQYESRQRAKSAEDDLTRRIGLMLRDKEGNHPIDEKQFELLQRQLERAKAKRKSFEPQPEPRLTPEERRRENAREELNGANPAEFIAGLGPLAQFIPAPAELPSGDLTKAAEKVTAKLDAVLEKFLTNREDKVDKATALAKARTAHAAMLVSGAPKVKTVIYRTRGFNKRRSVGEVEWPTQTAFSADLNKSITRELGIAFVCWLFPKESLARLEDEIHRLYDGEDDHGVSPNERDAIEDKLRAEWLALQRVQVRIAEELRAPIPEVHALAYFEVERAPSRERPEAYLQVTEGGALNAGAPVAEALADFTKGK
jgi:hypothetical protein